MSRGVWELDCCILYVVWERGGRGLGGGGEGGGARGEEGKEKSGGGGSLGKLQSIKEGQVESG